MIAWIVKIDRVTSPKENKGMAVSTSNRQVIQSGKPLRLQMLGS